ncbi:uncharacterized protein LOC144633261 isoform X2 [Oculina patagonica]
MPARRNFVSVALLSVILCTLIKESEESFSDQAECLRVCDLARQERSKTGVQDSRSHICHQCLKRRKDRQSLTIIQRQRRSLFQYSNCVGATEGNSAPNNVTSSKVTVTFGQYRNTSHWYVNVSWTPLKDFSGYYATLIRLAFEDDANVYCTKLTKNQTFLDINISFYGYTYPDPIYLLVLGLPYRSKKIKTPSYRPTKPTPSTVAETTANYTDLNSSSTTAPPTTPFQTSVFPTTNKNSSTTYFTSKKTSPKEGIFPTTNEKTSTTQTFASINVRATKGKHFINVFKLFPSDEKRVLINNESYFFLHAGPNHTPKYVAIAAASGIVLGLALVLGFLKCMFWYARRKRRGSFPVPSGFDYHAFIIYSKEDEMMMKKLQYLLEERYHLRCCIHYRDFTPGKPFTESMAESVHRSFKIIAVYSQNFVNSDYCTYELNLVNYRLLNKNDNCLVVFRIDGTDFNKLPQGIHERSVIDYHSVAERHFWVRRLLRFLEVPVNSDNQNDIAEQDEDNNNTCNNYHATGRKVRNSFVRLNSTTSTDTTVSYV